MGGNSSKPNLTNIETVHIPGLPISESVSSSEHQPFQPWSTLIIDDSGKPVRIIKENEKFEAKCCLMWAPLIKRVVSEGAQFGIIHEKHIPLFENILFGLISIESCGSYLQTGNFGISEYQRIIGSFRGLSQMVAEKHYLEENPYDPLTSIRIGLRNTAPFVYKAGNVESALAEHNNGKINLKQSRISVDAFCTIGQEFAMRVVNAAWWGHYLNANKERLSGREYFEQNWSLRNNVYQKYAPPWDFLKLDRFGNLEISEPDLPFNWEPPHTCKAWAYIKKFSGNNLEDKLYYMTKRTISRHVWPEDLDFKFPVHKEPGRDKSACQQAYGDAEIKLHGIEIPDWFYTESIAPDIEPLELRALKPSDWEAFPQGIIGLIPAKQGDRHYLYLENDNILEDKVGRDREGRWYIYTREYYQKQGGL